LTLISEEHVATLKLTNAAIARIAAPDPSRRQAIFWDRELRGFGVLVSGTTDAKSFIVQRRLPSGKSRRVTVGATAEFARVEDARRKAGALLLGLREGKDPREERRKAAARDRTLGHWFERYVEARKKLRASSVDHYRKWLALYLDDWRDRPIREITPDMVEERHAAIGKTAGPASANVAMKLLRAIWTFAGDRDETLAANPVRRLKESWFPIAPRTRMVKPDQLPAFYRALEGLENQIVADFLRLLLFTGMRRNEAAALRWDEVDFSERVIRLPAARSKNKRALDLPMTSFVRDLLVARRVLGDDGGFVFGGSGRTGHLVDPARSLEEIEAKTGIRISPHDLRRTFITVAESTNISYLSLKALVNHSIGGDITAGYMQMSTERLRGPAQRVCDRLAERCGIEVPDGAVKIGDHG
jgi:integrase